MTKPLTLDPLQWEKLKDRLKNDYKPSVMLIRSKMREKLGFTDRTHTTWPEDGVYLRPITKVYLDFYNEPKRTMFLLKYSEYLDKSGKTDY